MTRGPARRTNRSIFSPGDWARKAQLLGTRIGLCPRRAGDRCAPQILRPVRREALGRCPSGRAGCPVGAATYWYNVAPSPLMAFHDPPPSVGCRHTRPPCANVPSAAGGGELVPPEAAGAPPRAPRQAETDGSGDASHPRAALTPAGVALAPDGGPARHAHQVASSGRAAPLAVEVAARRPPILANVQRLIVSMAQANPTWGEERIANEVRRA